MNNLVNLLWGFLKALVFTLIVEETVALIFFRGRKYIFISILFINILTNPLINLLYALINLYIKIKPYDIIVIVMEIIVVIAEWKLLEYALNRKSNFYLVYSGTANALSYLLGHFMF